MTDSHSVTGFSEEHQKAFDDFCNSDYFKVLDLQARMTKDIEEYLASKNYSVKEAQAFIDGVQFIGTWIKDNFEEETNG